MPAFNERVRVVVRTFVDAGTCVPEPECFYAFTNTAGIVSKIVIYPVPNDIVAVATIFRKPTA